MMFLPQFFVWFIWLSELASHCKKMDVRFLFVDEEPMKSIDSTGWTSSSKRFLKWTTSQAWFSGRMVFQLVSYVVPSTKGDM